VLAFSYQGVEANGATYVIEDGSGGNCGEIGTWDGDTCTLTSDLASGETIDLNGDGITLDGNGKFLSGIDCSDTGISAIGQVDVTIKDVRVTGFFNGIHLYDTERSTVEDSEANANCNIGIKLEHANQNLISNNDANINCLFTFEDDCAGISLYNSNFNDIRNNDANENGFEFDDDEVEVEVGHGLAIINGGEGFDGVNFVTGNEFDDNGDEGIRIEDSFNNFIGVLPPFDVRDIDTGPGDLAEDVPFACDALLDVGGIVIGNSMDRNGDNGIVVDDGSHLHCIIDNTADGNDDDGIDIRSENNDMRENQANNNDDDGFDINEILNYLKDNDANDNHDDGIHIDEVDAFFEFGECGGGTFLDGNTANGNAESGFDVEESDCTFLVSNVAKFNGEEGYEIQDSDHVTLLGNLAEGHDRDEDGDDGFGFNFENSDHLYIGIIPGETVEEVDCNRETAFNFGNTARDNENDGFSFQDSDNNCIANNVAIANANVGFDLNDDSSDNSLICNLAEANSSDGIESEDSFDNEIIENTLFENGGWGVDIDDGGFIDVFFNHFLFNEDLPQLTIRNGASPVDVAGNTFDDLEADLCIEPLGELPEPPEPEPEQVTDVICNIPEGTQTEINQSGDNIQFTFNSTCDVTAGDSTEEIDVEITVDKDAEGLGLLDIESDVDLNFWTEESFGANQWDVSNDGLTVVQNANGNPTFFFGPFDSFATQFSVNIKPGTISSGNFNDDDYIGFALGFQPGDVTNPDADYLLIDWKQGTQFAFGTQAFKGLAVSRVTGIPTNGEFWAHDDSTPNGGKLVELARGINLGDVGWVDEQEYVFTFVFTSTSLQVFVDGVLEIDIEGNFSNGRTAFYNFSQDPVTYSGGVLLPIFDESGTVTIEFLDGSGTLIIAEEGGILVDSEGPTYFIDGTSTGLVGTGAYENLTCEIGEQTFTAIDDNDSVSGEVSLTGCSELVPEPDGSNGGDNQWDKRPTFGVSHEDLQSQIVENGFSFNGEYFTVTDNYHTDFAEQSVEIGAINTFSATVYTDKGLWIQEFLFGVPGVGEGHLAELGVEVWYDNGEIDEVKVVQNSDVIDADTVSVSHEMTKCLPTDAEARCNTTTVSMTFLEPLIDKVMIIGAIDNDRRSERTSLNEGFDISGESLNPMLANMIPSTVRYEGLIKVTQVEKYSPYWVTDDNRMFEMNSFGSFKQINQSFERFQDTGSAFTRMHSGFGGIIAYEQNRALDIFDATSLVSELPPSFAYIFPEAHERITEEMRQEMLVQEEIAKQVLDEMDRQDRHH